MLVDEIKRRIAQAMKAGRTVEKEVLRVALGEIQTADARGADTMGDEGATAIVRKLIKSNEETASLTSDPARRDTLNQETSVLRSLLPQGLSVDQIVESLSPLRDAIRAAPNDGQATGIAMKQVKSSGAVASGKDVAEAVRRMRA